MTARWREGGSADLASSRRAPLGLFLFLFSMGLLEGLDFDEIAGKVKSLWWPLLVANWQVWPLLQLINFRFVPLR